MNRTQRAKEIRGRAYNKARYKALSQPITAEQHMNFKKHLLAIPHGPDFCWVHVSKVTTGKVKSYAKVKYNGFWVPTHRFALAMKMGCTPWDLEGFNAGHAPAWECMGGRCCNPSHLTKQTTPVNAWQRSADHREVGLKPERTPEEKRRLVNYMHPKGLPTGDMLLGRIVTFGCGKNVFQNRVLEPINTAQTLA
jgi:hypothetical protein